jgi:hypothetical protein
MKKYFENSDFLIPFEKVMFIKYDIAGTIFIFFSAQYTSGGRIVEKIMLDGHEAKHFVKEYKTWLEL